MDKIGSISRIVAFLGIGRPSAAKLPAEHCPWQNKVTAYRDTSLPPEQEAELLAHVGGCEGCLELLVLLTKAGQQEKSRISETSITEQVKRIIRYVEADQTAQLVSDVADASKRGAGAFFMTFPQLAAAALLICAFGLGALFWLTQEEPRGEAAMKLLTQAVSQGRRTEGWVAGLPEHSDYSATRGAESRDELPFDRALTKAKFAEETGASAVDRLVLARVRLATGKREEVSKALVLLDQLAKDDSLPASTHAEVYNDIGVAVLQLGNYGVAIESFDKALAKSPDLAEAVFNKALALERAGRYADAREAWAQFMNTSANNDWKAEARSHLQQLTSPDLK